MVPPGRVTSMTVVERVPTWDAAAMLGVSHATIWKMIRDGVLAAESNPLDTRETLVRVADLDALKAESYVTRRPWPRTIGAADLGVQSDGIEGWLEANWRPC